MPGPAQVEVVGLREVQSALRALDNSFARELTPLNRKAAQVVATEATSRVPVRSGRLKASIRATAQQRQGEVKAGRATVPYAGPIEFGWAAHNITAQPFLFPALDAKKEDVIELYEHLIRQLVDHHF